VGGSGGLSVTRLFHPAPGVRGKLAVVINRTSTSGAELGTRRAAFPVTWARSSQVTDPERGIASPETDTAPSRAAAAGCPCRAVLAPAAGAGGHGPAAPKRSWGGLGAARDLLPHLGRAHPEQLRQKGLHLSNGSG